MNPQTVIRLSENPCQSGRWWIHAPHGETSVALLDQLAEEAQKKWPGRVAVLDAAATMISNLRVWENMVLPAWVRDGGDLSGLERQLAAIFDLAGIPESQREKLTVRLPAMLDRSERRLVLLIRSLLVEPACVIMEDELWRDLTSRGHETAHAQLFAVLQNTDCFVVVGSSPVQADFSPVDIVN